MISLLTRILWCSIFCTALFFVATPSVAQAQNQSSDDSDADLDEIVVTATGSLIKRDTSSRAPIEVVDREFFDSAGYSNIVDVTRNLTVNSGSVLVQTTGNLAGIAQVNLRGLGLGSTLTLINGRRAGIAAIADAGGNDFFDTNQLPLAMIERIEFLKDGASSTYGSQAVAGVANVITRKGFEGLEISLRYEDSTNNAGMINLAAGSALGDRGHFNVYATYYNQEGGDRSDYDFIVERLGGRLQGVDPSPASAGRLTSSTGQPGSYVAAITDPVTGEVTPFSGSTFPDPNCEAAGGILVGSRCRHDFFDQISVIQDEERYQVFTEMDFEINDSVTFFGEAHLSRNRVERTSGPNPYGNGLVSTGAILIPGDHPFNFFVADPTAATGIRYIDPANWDPATDVGVDIVCTCRPIGVNSNGEGNAPPQKWALDYWRGMGGMAFDLPNEWTAEVSYQYSAARRAGHSSFNYIAATINQSALDGTWNPFGSSLATPGLVSPKNPLVVAGNSQDILDSLSTTQQDLFESSQKTLDAVVTGDVFELPGGPVGIAFGAQFRDEEFEFTPDALKAAAQSQSRNPLFPSEGNQDVFSIFGEAILPVSDRIEVQVALRYEDYGDQGGTTTDPKIAVRFDATDRFALRGSFGTSFQAPTIRQLSESSSRQVVDDSAVIDPISGALTCGPGGVSISGEILLTSSPGLEAQSAKNFNFGAIFEPLDNLSVVLDYWNFDYEDLISPDEGPQAIIDNDCASDGIPNDPRVERDGGGNIRRVTTFVVNTARVKTDGIDLTANYSFDLGDTTEVYLTGQASFINSFEFENIAGGGFTDIVGSRNTANQFRSLPEVRAYVGAQFLRGNHSFGGTVRYIDSYVNDRNGDTVDSFTTLDLQYGLTLDGLFGGNETKITIGARNVFDEEPPTLGFRDRPGFDDVVHDIRGRILYASLTQLF